MSETCCAVGPRHAAPACPVCKRPTKPVERSTILHHLQPVLAPDLPDLAFGFCETPTCDVVYAATGAPPIHKADLVTRVGLKETDDPILVCYCWTFTEAHVIDDLLANGRSTVREFIQGRVAAGECSCEVNNPSGRCCLGNVGKAIKKGEAVTAARPTAYAGAER